MSDLERVQTERDIAKQAYVDADNERIRLRARVEELERQLDGSAVPELQKQVREARVMIRDIVHKVIAPMSKWQRGRRLMDQNLAVLDEAVVQIKLLGESN